MIGKVAASGSGFRGVINYIMLGKKDAPNPDRVAWTMAYNLLSQNPDHAPALMRATANQSARCKKPVYHLAISWHQDENPSDDLMREVGIDTLRDLELAEHQAYFVAHKDTAHRHLHIIINRVHPETGRAWSNSNDYKRIEISMRRQAEARGLPYVPGRFNDPERFGLKGRAARDGEFQAAVRHGKPAPKAMWSRDDIAGLRAVLAPAFSEAATWDDLSMRVAELGFRLSPKGQGLIIEGSDGFMKLSDLGKQVRVKTLEDTFGETYASFAGRSTRIDDDMLKSGAGLFPSASKNLQSPGQSPRRRPGKDALKSPGTSQDGDEDDVTVRDAFRRASRIHRASLDRKRKPAEGGDDGIPGEVPHPNADPREQAYHKVRAARAEVQRTRREAMDGKADALQLSEAEYRLQEARDELARLLEQAADKDADLRANVTAAPARKPTDSRAEPEKPRSPPQHAKASAPHASDAFEARGEAFGALRAARQAQNMAEALFNAGVISEKELKAAADDVKRAAEMLQPHLSLEEQLQNDIAGALRGFLRKPAPKKGGPSR